ncbi:hypothetical protein GCT13_32090 [Paraburkholderia sp. CNPSo 3157]|uniref:Uncharacterized protein n=1 Tax=Paraburkholderia franconis TaxID=2654983 RepID=A0A7X1TJF8_9BURK|nr:hypothetical protein [Paraburkholderia franconis]MPW21388.1 hypothetical protein [Paraburkholderia franconis]
MAQLERRDSQRNHSNYYTLIRRRIVALPRVQNIGQLFGDHRTDRVNRIVSPSVLLSQGDAWLGPPATMLLSRTSLDTALAIGERIRAAIASTTFASEIGRDVSRHDRNRVGAA